MNPPAPPPAPPGKPTLEQIVAQTEAAIAMGQLERARQQLSWAWQVYGGVPALQAIAARLLAPPESGGRQRAPDELPTLPFVRQVDGRPAAPLAAVSAELPTVPLTPQAQMVTQPMPRLTIQSPPLPPPAPVTPPAPAAISQPPAPSAAVSADLPTLAFPTTVLPPPAASGPPPVPGSVPPAQIEAWVQESQQLVRAGNYDGALALLARALGSAPHDENLQRHHQLTEKAVQRHRAALEREQAIGLAGREIAARLAQGELAEARQALRDALLEHGRHPAFDELQARLETRLAEHKQLETDERLGEARFAYQNGDWQQAIAAADECLALSPGQAEALELRRQAQLQLSNIGREKMQREALDAAVRDVERLLGGKELQPASLKLTQAVQRLGHHPAFDELQKRIDAAKSEQQYQLRHDWAERRARELEGLIQESVRASMAGDFQKAVEKLEAAKKLEPEHPELESKLETARGLFDKQRAEQRKAAELAGALDDLRGHLDALALDRAEHLLQRASARFPEAADRFAPLRQRLLHLREAEGAVSLSSGHHYSLPTPEDLTKLNRHTEAALADRERALAGAYSWGQALLFPLRGAGPALLLIFGALLLGLDAAVAYLPLLGPVRTALPLLFFFFTLPLLSATLEGANQPRWADLKMGGRDLLVGFLGVLLPAFLALPLLIFVVIRGNHHLLDASAGPLGFLALVALAWPIFPPLLPVLGITAAFGPRHLPRIGKHLRFMALGGGAPWWVVAFTFGLFLAAFFARLALGPAVPFLGLPFAALFAAYALVGLPHWIGIAVRRRRLELARLYS